MATFRLTVLDATHQILSTERQLRKQEYEGLRKAFEFWKEHEGVIVIADCEVVGGATIEIDLVIPDDETAQGAWAAAHEFAEARSQAEVRHERLLEGLPDA